MSGAGSGRSGRSRAGRKGRSDRDERRRRLGQNFLIDRGAIVTVLTALDLRPGELVVEPGAGTGALTLPLARAGAEVVAIELDPAWAERLERSVARAGLTERVTVVRGDARRVGLPAAEHRVVGNLPFAATTDLLRHWLDQPASGPRRVDVIVQADVARKRARTPPTTLVSAGWAPWWDVELGPVVPRRAFRPEPRVDAALLTYRRRNPPVLPDDLAPGFADLLRGRWSS